MKDLELLSRQTDEVEWPEFVALPLERVLTGNPTHSTVVILDEANFQLGVWRATPGSFTTDHSGYLEYVYIIEGKGHLVSADGTSENLQPGKVVLMPFDWVGRWEIEETITKAYSIVRAN
jgi:uncharacterized cupin superfamily protein